MNFPIAFKAMDCKLYAVRVGKIRFSGARKPVFKYVWSFCYHQALKETLK